VKEARLSPYVAEKLAGMSARWTVPELRRALEGLFALDSLVKAADGGTSTEEGRRLAFTLWLADTLGAC
jgi:DNA polymerase III delta subunit